MFDWLKKKMKQEREAKRHIERFVDHNLKMVEKYRNPENQEKPHMKVTATLRPIVPIPPGLEIRSWLGGRPRLPDGMAWPEVDGTPLQFIGQLDCRAFPENLWGGLGPRDGWLAIFVGGEKRLQARVIHCVELGPKKTSPTPRDRLRMFVTPFMDAPDGFDLEAPSWPVEISVLENTADAVRESGSLLAFRDRILDFDDPIQRPGDWDDILLVLQLMYYEVVKKLERTERALTRVNARMMLPPPDPAIAERVLHETQEMRARLDVEDDGGAFGEAEWTLYADMSAGWRDAWISHSLETFQSPQRVLHGLELSGEDLRRLSRERLAAKPAIAKRLDDIIKQIGVLSKALKNNQSFVSIPVDEREINAWFVFAERFPEEWLRLKQTIQEQASQLNAFEAILHPTKDMKGRFINTQEYRYRGPVPENRDDARGLLDKYVSQSKEWVTTLLEAKTNDMDEAERARSDFAEQQSNVSILVEMLDAVTIGRDSGKGFVFEDWVQLMQDASMIVPLSHIQKSYSILRGYRFAQAYTANPDSLPDAVHDHYLAWWQLLATKNIATLGGITTGFSYELLEQIDSSALMLELPSSDLFGWIWGDVYHLLLIVPLDDLAHGEFGNVVCDITN